MRKPPWSLPPSLGAVCLLGVTAGASAAATRSPSARIARAAAAARDDLVGELERLTRGLLFVSEADSPLSVVTWRQPGGAPTATRLAGLTGEPHPDLAQVMTVDEFFRPATTPMPGDDAEERAIARRYASIVHFLKTRLSGVRVFRFGSLTIRSYVVGSTPSGDWLGLSTTQTET